jgi:extradiol dioxygenase family protein
MYPRHFGITFRHREDWDALVRLARVRGAPFFAEPSQRWEGLIEEHWTFMLIDPSNNLIEFKHYLDPRMMY